MKCWYWEVSPDFSKMTDMDFVLSVCSRGILPFCIVSVPHFGADFHLLVCEQRSPFPVLIDNRAALEGTLVDARGGNKN